MVREGYEWAGVAAVIRAVAGSIAVALVVTLDVVNGSIFQPWQPSHLLLFVVIDGLSMLAGVYAALKFREMLNRDYLCHAVDDLILVLICLGVAGTVVSFGFRVAVVVQPGLVPLVLGLLVILCMVSGVVGILFATRLLHIETDLGGYKKPLAYVCMAQSVGYALFVTAALAAATEIVYYILLATIFFRSGKQPEELEII